MIKKVTLFILVIVQLISLACCGISNENPDTGYAQITAEEAKYIMDNEEEYVILDVRTEEEFVEGHIPGAVLIPDYEIKDRAEMEMPDKEQTILVYCRSGNRSKNASALLAEMGYTDVREFGGINDWLYEIEKDKSYRPCNKPGDEKFKQE